jgi:hypothetical protein
MLLATTNKVKRLLHLSFIGHVRADDLARGREDVAVLLGELPAGFRVLTDFGRLETMDIACAAELGRIMELCDQRGVGMVVRVIPDLRKDIGLNILSEFHYEHSLAGATCASVEEAARVLSLWIAKGGHAPVGRRGTAHILCAVTAGKKMLAMLALSGFKSRGKLWIMKPHRGTLILVLGILSLVICGFLGIPAWIMGNSDLAQMQAGQMDPSGRSLTNAGRICGMIATILLIVGVIVAVALLAFGVLGSIAARR